MDVTEFHLLGRRIYLSSILDLHSREVVGHATSFTPSVPFVMQSLEKALQKRKTRPHILHSDQGFQYQNRRFITKLRESGIDQSMSRKGNCLDNAVIENFFSILKTEFYHGERFTSINQFLRSLHAYIDYYNNERISLKLKGLTPAEVRNQSSQVQLY